jgi:hypothetical protein
MMQSIPSMPTPDPTRPVAKASALHLLAGGALVEGTNHARLTPLGGAVVQRLRARRRRQRIRAQHLQAQAGSR